MVNFSKVVNSFGPAIVFPPKLDQDTLDPLRDHPIWCSERGERATGSFLYDEKSWPENVEYMMKNMFLGGNPNRQQDIF